MNLREAAQQALEALKMIDNAMPFPVAKHAIKQLRDALAEPEQGGVCGRCGAWAVDPVLPDEQRKPLTDEEILSDEVLRYHFGCNGGAGPVSQKGIKIIRAVERAHGIGGEA